jgi:hypothetical protein
VDICPEGSGFVKKHRFNIWQQPCSLTVGQVAQLGQDKHDEVQGVWYRPNEWTVVQLIQLPEHPYDIVELGLLFDAVVAIWNRCEVSYGVLSVVAQEDERVRDVEGQLIGLNGDWEWEEEEGMVISNCRATIDCPHAVGAGFNPDEETPATLEAKLKQALGAALD